MSDDVEEIVRRLDGIEGTADSYDARAELIYLGQSVVPTVIRLLPTLAPYGQLTAIEVFEELRDPRCGTALIELLTSPDPTVRQWAGVALGELGVGEAVEPIRSAYWACIQRGTPPDWSEPVGLRNALTTLGVRRPVLPIRTQSLAVRLDELRGSEAWPSKRLEEVINDLADHAQAILYFQPWTLCDDSAYGFQNPCVDREIDWTAPWPQLVADAREWSLLEAEEMRRADNVVVTVEWIAESDLRRS